jgi:hypothetical protein
MKNISTITLSVFAACIFALVIIFSQNKAQTRNQAETISSDQVRKAVQTLSAMVTDQNFQTFGLTGKDQLKSLKAGKQYNKSIIGLDAIKNYKAGQDVQAIIKPLAAIEVPLVDESGKIQTAIEFVKNKDKWEASGFGLSSDLAAVRNAQANRADTSKANVSLIRIPALRTRFIGVTTSTGLSFIVLENNESLGFRQGETILAKDAILKLVSVAKLYNGLPD